jgi:magnesium transporter
MRHNEFVALAQEDQQSIAQRMMHYNLNIVPVVSEDNFFLGVIPSTTLVDVIEEESAEDVYRMSAMSPVKGTYLEESFFKQLYQRSYILIVLMLVQSLSSIILKYNTDLLATVSGGLLLQFLTMLVGTGGNAGSQTSGVVIQGMASGEINNANLKKFFKREFLLACAIGLVLGMTVFARVYTTSANMIGSIAVSSSVLCVVIVSIVIGSTVPVLLRRLSIDPAYWAGPVLGTVMDVLGLLIYCTVAQAIFSYFTNFS